MIRNILLSCIFGTTVNLLFVSMRVESALSRMLEVMGKREERLKQDEITYVDLGDGRAQLCVKDNIKYRTSCKFIEVKEDIK